MKRLSLIALTLGLTTLVAWGCGSGSTAPDPNTLVPDVNNPDGLLTNPGGDANPGGTNPTLGGDDSDAPDNSLQIGGSDPGQPNNAEHTNGEADTTNGPARGTSAPRRDCLGGLHYVNPSSNDWFFNFNRDSASSTNGNRRFTINTEDGEEAEVTLIGATWSASNPLESATKTFSFSATGAFEHPTRPGVCNTNIQIGYSDPDTTCLTINSLSVQHAGPLQHVTNSLAFGGGLTLTANRYAPVKGERHAGIVGKEGTGIPSYWISEITEVETYFGREFVTFTIHPAGETFPTYEFTWCNDYGIVAVVDPFINDGTSTNRHLFPGYPAR